MYRTYDTPLEAQKDLSDEEDLLARRKEDDEQEACHNAEGAQEDLARAECRDEPAIEDGAEDGTDTCDVVSILGRAVNE